MNVDSESMLRLAAHLLEMAGDQYANHGCNDFPEFAKIVPDYEQRRAIVKAYHEWNGDPEEYDPEQAVHPYAMQDFALMGFLAWWLVQPRESR